MLAVAGQEVDKGECSILMAGICNCYSYHPAVEIAHPYLAAGKPEYQFWLCQWHPAEWLSEPIFLIWATFITLVSMCPRSNPVGTEEIHDYSNFTRYETGSEKLGYLGWAHS